MLVKKHSALPANIYRRKYGKFRDQIYCGEHRGSGGMVRWNIRGIPNPTGACRDGVLMNIKWTLTAVAIIALMGMGVWSQHGTIERAVEVRARAGVHTPAE